MVIYGIKSLIVCFFMGGACLSSLGQSLEVTPRDKASFLVNHAQFLVDL